MIAVLQDAAAEGLMGIQIVAQQRGVAVQPRKVTGPFLVQPAFAGSDFTVLFVVSVLGCNELRT